MVLAGILFFVICFIVMGFSALNLMFKNVRKHDRQQKAYFTAIRKENEERLARQVREQKMKELVANIRGLFHPKFEKE